MSAAEPVLQVQRYDADTFVLRQSIRTNFEGPFLYLLFGRDRALLLDTGAGGLRIRPAIERLLSDWARAHGRAAVPLVVAHSHGHGDHHQSDAEFAGRPDTIVVGLAPEAVARFFGVRDWPSEVVGYDLGGRILDVIPAPGHQPAGVVLYDRRTGLLLTGDTLGPYRLYFPSDAFDAYRATIDRLAAFTAARKVSHILGAHIEMTRTPGELIPDEAPSHPDERALELPASDVFELQAALHAMGETPRREVHRDFVVFPLPPTRAASPKGPAAAPDAAPSAGSP